MASLIPRPSSVPAAVDPVSAYLGRLHEGSHRTMMGCVQVLAETLFPNLPEGADLRQVPWGQLTYAHTQAIRAKLISSGLRPATINKHLSALRGLLDEAFKLGQMSAEQHQRARAVENVPNDDPPAGRAIEPHELKRLFNACDPRTASGAKDLALLSLMFGAGMRRDEVAGLERSNVDTARAELHVIGKGSKARIIRLGKSVLAGLAPWLRIRGNSPGPFIWRVSKSGEVTPAGIGQQSVYDALTRIASRAGVDDISPHDLRRTFASELLDRGADVVAVQRLMGHSQVQTTAQYDRRGERAERAAAERLHLPIPRPR